MDLAYSFDFDREDMLELLASWNGACPAGERIPLADAMFPEPKEERLVKLRCSGCGCVIEAPLPINYPGTPCPVCGCVGTKEDPK